MEGIFPRKHKEMKSRERHAPMKMSGNVFCATASNGWTKGEEGKETDPALCPPPRRVLGLQAGAFYYHKKNKETY